MLYLLLMYIYYQSYGKIVCLNFIKNNYPFVKYYLKHKVFGHN